MLAHITKLVGYTKAPTATYMMRHPIRGARLWKASRQPLNVAAIAGAGAAVLALPIGIWLARRNQDDAVN